MIRVLYVNGGIMQRGGIESYMMNYYRHLDRNKIQIDFIVHGYGRGVYDDEIQSMGGKIYHVPVKSKNLIGNIIGIYNICEKGNYQIIHSHMDAMSYLPLKIAKICGIPVRIAHSHNTDYLTQNKVKRWLNNKARAKIPRVATDLFACSQKAGEWLYGEKKFEIVYNAIDIEKFQYNESIRQKIRNLLGLDEADIVIGHIGRFEYQKNHEFLIDVFSAVHKENPRFKLIMVGDGSLKDEMKQKVRELEVSADACFFIDSCNNANEYYNAFDLLCFPSHFEGLSVVLIEAQCNGLHCIVSDTTSREADISDNISFKPIGEKHINEWKKIIMNFDYLHDVASSRRVVEKGYSIESEAELLQKRYQELVDNIR